MVLVAVVVSVADAVGVVVADVVGVVVVAGVAVAWVAVAGATDAEDAGVAVSVAFGGKVGRCDAPCCSLLLGGSLLSLLSFVFFSSPAMVRVRQVEVKARLQAKAKKRSCKNCACCAVFFCSVFVCLFVWLFVRCCCCCCCLALFFKHPPKRKQQHSANGEENSKEDSKEDMHTLEGRGETLLLLLLLSCLLLLLLLSCLFVWSFRLFAWLEETRALCTRGT